MVVMAFDHGLKPVVIGLPSQATFVIIDLKTRFINNLGGQSSFNHGLQPVGKQAPWIGL
jgi:hypothetical protein